ncbi:MAG: hypothetical protein AAF657_07600 [Acidobacteriota bacterium]
MHPPTRHRVRYTVLRCAGFRYAAFRYAVFSLGLLTSAVVTAEKAPRLLDERGFRLAKHGSDQVIITPGEAGILVVRARVKKPLPTLPIRLLLEGPDGLQIEKQDSSPLRLRYPLDEALAKASWRASVVNVSNLGPVTGQLTVELEPGASAPAASSIAQPKGQSKLTEGRVRVVDDQQIRAACRDKNTDVFVRLDMHDGRGAFYMGFNPVFTLTASYSSDRVIEMRGSGEHPLYLDLDQRILYFASGEEGTFCRARIFLGEEL